MDVAPDMEVFEQLHSSARSCVRRRRTEGGYVIVKRPNQEFPSFQDNARFRREFEIARRCAHPGVVEPLALVQEGGRWTMSFADIGGASLDKVLRQRPLALDEFFSIALQLCDAVDAVHARGVVHKDINPANLVWNAASGRLQLIDFGIASELPQEAQGPVHPLALEGTLAYMAPEQTGRMNRLLDYRADLYAIGATFYALLAGQPPFTASDAMALIHCHIACTPDWSLPAFEALPDGLLAILQRLLEKDACRRYQAVAALAADLQACRDARPRAAARLADRPPRFMMPPTLVGRDAELAALMAAFERCAAGATELVLVGGYSGIGKSALVNEVHKPIVARRGAFLAGKFDQFRRDVPYASLLEALRGLVRQLLSEAESALAQHRLDLHAALGAGLAVMVELLPELALVLGPMAATLAPPAPLPPAQAQARLGRILPIFLDAFAGPGRPLVVFLDDLQWADAPTLRMLEMLVRRGGAGGQPGQGGHLLLVGAYRDNETPPGHPLSVLCDALRRDRLALSTLLLAPLALADIERLLAHALQVAPDNCAPLAALCLHKTGGNPFFLNQFLQALAEQGALRYERAQDHWRCDLAAVAARHSTDNVADLLAAQIGRLPAPARSLLQLGAAIGSRFELATLAVVAELAPAHAQAALWPALAAGLLLPVDGSYKYIDRATADASGGVAYRFQHDRVQQAAYLLADQGERAARHLRIGRLLLAHASAGQREQSLFAIVEQIDAGRALITDGDEQLQMAHLNQLAAAKARRSAAFQAALAYNRVGLALLAGQPADPLPVQQWQPRAGQHGLWFELALGAAEAAYLCGDADLAEAIYPRVRAHCHDRLEHVRCIAVQAHQYQLQGRLLDAIAVQREGLALLGVALPQATDELLALGERLFGELMAAPIVQAGSEAAVNALVAADDLRDPAAIATMQLMQGLWMAAYYAGQQALCVVMIMSMTRLSIERGNSDFAAVGYVGFAMIRMVKGDDADAAWRFGAMAMRLARSRANLQTRTLAGLMFGAAVSHWTRPLRESDALYDEALGWALEAGDFVQVGVVVAVRATDRIALGAYLPDLLETVRRDIAVMRANGQHAMADCCVAAAVAPICELMGESAPPAAAGAREPGQQQFLAQYGDSALYQAYYLQGQIRNAYLFERADAEALALQLEVVTRLMRGQAKVHETSFYAALVWLRALRTARPLDEQAAIEARLHALMTDLERWAVHGAANIGPKLALVRAELARNRGQVGAAMAAYRDAADLAGAAGYINLQALAHALCAQFWQGQGQPKVAAVFQRDAIGRYRQWGAQALAERLQAAPLGHRAPPASIGAGVGIGTGIGAGASTARAAGNDALDLASLLKAAQALGHEVGLAAVLGRLIAIVRENAGAQVARLLLRDGAALSPLAAAAAPAAPAPALWRLEADIGVDGVPALPGRVIDLDAAADDALPLSLLRYVVRSGAAVIEERLGAAPLFGADPYVPAHGACSAMCLPILRAGRVEGLLYLENSLVEGCFTGERVEFLRLLAAQAMISIAHARMHDSLEARVAERTAQLEEANRQLATLSVTDALTSLANRRHFDDVLRREWARCQRAGASIGVIMVDIDHFKKYNDHYGHQAGDACLARVAATLQAALRRPGDLLARYGGEEFCVVLPEANRSDAAQTAERLRAAVAALALAHAASPLGTISISVGVAVSQPQPTSAADEVLRDADAALYRAKAAGRDCVAMAPAGAATAA